jgi:hypothetical protein
MFTYIHTASARLRHDRGARNICGENPLLICLPILALIAISCHRYSFPTTPADQNDVGLWNSVKVDSVGRGSIIAALYPDGIPHLYNGTIEYSCGNNVWTKRSINPEAPEILSTQVGKCRNDGILRMYGVFSNNVYEFNYTNNRWTRQIIANSVGAFRFAIGDARNDGYESLYLYDGNWIREVRCQDGTWTSSAVEYTADIGCLCAGDGRGDGKGGIYTMSYTSEIFELRLENSSWKRTKIGQIDTLPPNSIEAYAALALTHTHNGSANVMASTGDLFEFHYDTDHWTRVRVGSEPGIIQICDGVGRNDGTNRIYCAVCFDITAEYTLIGNSWVKTSQRKQGLYAATSSVVVGSARGDGINRVYVSKFMDGLYEYTFNQ